MIALVDCNNFFVSCERIFRPDLANKPVCVLSSNDGCVIARSQEVKNLGVEMGAPAFRYRELFSKKNITLFSTNFPLYGDISNRVMTILRNFSNCVDIYSIDESFLNLDFLDSGYPEYGKEIRATVLKWVGIPTCVGIAETKTLAKLANRIAKKYPELEGVHCIDSEEKRIKALKWCGIGDIWGIGRKNSQKLKQLQVYTGYDFIQLSDSVIRHRFGITTLRIKKELEGTPCIEFDIGTSAQKSIMVSRSLAKGVSDINILRECMADYAARCAEKLRRQNSCASGITAFLRTPWYRKDLKQFSASKNFTFEVPTNNTAELAEVSERLLTEMYKDGYKYGKLGVITYGLVDSNCVQGNLFDSKDRKKLSTLDKVIDSINKSGGRGTIRLAGMGRDFSKATRKDNLSPAHTTRWKEILQIGKK